MRSLKNFPTPDDLASHLGPHRDRPAITSLPYYWAATFRTFGG